MGDDHGPHDRPDDGPPEGRRPEVSTTGPDTPETAALPPCPDPGPITLPDQQVVDGVAPTTLALEVSSDGTAATLRWDDPNAGRSTYVAYASCAAPDDGDRRVVGVVTPGAAPQLTVEGLSLDFNYCFTVGVLGTDAQATAYRSADGDSYLCLDQTTR